MRCMRRDIVWRSSTPMSGNRAWGLPQRSAWDWLPSHSTACRSSRRQACSLWARRRSTEERRLYREQSWQRYFVDPALITLSWDDLNLVDTPLWRGVPVDASSRLHLGPPGRPEILWMERCEEERRLVTHTPLAPNDVADIERAEGVHVQTWIAGELHGTLLGLLDQTGEALGLGILQR